MGGRERAIKGAARPSHGKVNMNMLDQEQWR